jgi:hypothetical protein
MYLGRYSLLWADLLDYPTFEPWRSEISGCISVISSAKGPGTLIQRRVKLLCQRFGNSLGKCGCFRDDCLYKCAGIGRDFDNGILDVLTVGFLLDNRSLGDEISNKLVAKGLQRVDEISKAQGVEQAERAGRGDGRRSRLEDGDQRVSLCLKLRFIAVVRVHSVI